MQVLRAGHGVGRGEPLFCELVNYAAASAFQ
jgi:hypothetical protein